MFIWLTSVNENQKALFNINNYDSIYRRSDDATILDRLGCKEYDMVQETPEQIQQKIKEAQNG